MSNGSTGQGPVIGPPMLSGEGSPEGLVKSTVGAIYRRTDGTVDTTLYIKETGEGTDTGWTPFGKTPPNLLVPTGTILDFAGSTTPSGYLLCFGQSVATATYPGLFAVIGYVWGGSGANFTIPDLRGYVLAGKDDMGGTDANRLSNWGTANTTLGGVGGNATVALAVAELPSHQHTGVDHTHTVPAHNHPFTAAYMNYTGTARGGSGTFSIDNVGLATSNYGAFGTSGADRALTTGATGSGTAHNNCQPTRIINKIIKT